jgi:glycerol kinase
LFGFGVPDPGTAYVNAGTGVFVQRVLGDPSVRAPHGLLESVVYAGSGGSVDVLRCHEGTVNGGYAAVEWLGQRTGLDVRRALAALSAPGRSGQAGLLFMNGVGGLAAPYWRAGFASEFLGVPGSPDAAAARADELEQLAAVVESIAFLVAVNLQAMQRVAPLRRVLITGGLAACDYLCEALADVTGLPVVRPVLREATARGVAWLAAGQPEGWQPVPVEREFAPSAQDSVRARFAQWQDALEARLAQ